MARIARALGRLSRLGVWEATVATQQQRQPLPAVLPRLRGARGGKVRGGAAAGGGTGGRCPQHSRLLDMGGWQLQEVMYQMAHRLFVVRAKIRLNRKLAGPPAIAREQLPEADRKFIVDHKLDLDKTQVWSDAQKDYVVQKLRRAIVRADVTPLWHNYLRELDAWEDDEPAAEEAAAAAAAANGPGADAGD